MTVVFLTSSSTSPWSRPYDWTDAGHQVELVGAGGNCGSRSTGTAGKGAPGGGGGAYSALTSPSGSLGSTTAFQVKANNPTAGGTTTNATSWESSAPATNAYVAQAGDAGSATAGTITGGVGGAGATNGSPTPVTYTRTSNSGGQGGGASATSLSGGGGGGGAAGPTGAGKAGGITASASAGGGGGGGGANGGSSTAGSAGSSTTGGNGGAGTGGTGGGSGGTTTGGAGSSGGGGEGSDGSANASVTLTGGAGGTLGNVTNWSQGGVGGGGGGVGGTSNNSTCVHNAGNGANFGGGGGGFGGARGTGSTTSGGTGGAGLIIITYTAVPPEVALLLHGDGADAATNIVDSSPNARTVTLNGNTQIDTAQKRFGVSSILFDGTGDFITLDGSSDFAFNTGDFTIDFWVRFNAVSAQQSLYDARAASGDIAGTIYLTSGNVLKYATAGTDRITGTTTLSTGFWYHVAVARSGTSTKLFLNGTQEGSTYTDSNAYVVGASRPTIGANGTNTANDNFNGWIDEYRVVKFVAEWTANFIPRATPYYKPIANLLLHAEGADASTTILDSGDGFNSPHTVTANGNAQIDTAQFKFGASSLLFDGTGDSLSLDGNADFTIGLSDFTIDCWLRINTTAVQQTIIDFRSSAANEVRPLLFVSSGNVLKYFVSNADRITGTTTLTTGTWYHVALTRQGTSTKLFLNGTQEGSTYTDSNNYAAIAASRPLIGLDYNSANGLNGWIDELRFLKNDAAWTANFTPPTAPYAGLGYAKHPYTFAKTVLLLHGEGADASTAIVDSSDPFHPPVLAGAVQIDTAQFKFGSSSILLNGSSDYLRLDGSADFAFGTEDFTVDFWFRLSSDTTNYFFDFSNTGEGNRLTAYHQAGSTIRVSDQNTEFLTSTTAPVINTWYHVAITRYLGTARLFINGVMEASASNTTNYAVSTNCPIIGQFYTLNFNFNGWLDEFRIIKGAAAWIANFKPPTQPYIGDEAPLSMPDQPEVLLLHANGADASTTISDSSRYTRTVTPAATAQLDTAQKRFGASSILFDGDSDYLLFPRNTDWNFRQRDFTIDFWLRLAATGVNHSLFNFGQQADFDPTYPQFLRAYVLGLDNKVYTARGTTGVNDGATALTANVWYHIAVTRCNGTCRLFVNGAVDSTVTLTVDLMAGGEFDPTNGLPAFGANFTPASIWQNFLSGWIDEVRIVNGRALWVANFIPHSRAYHGH